MTGKTPGALTGSNIKWHSIDWKATQRCVRRLQMRIAKAVKEGRHGKVKSLQWLLTHSFHAKLLAVKRVTTNKGKNTPGVDGVLFKGNPAKMQAALHLQRHGYKAQPLRRIYIPKKDGKKRPLSIPTMHDRAMQALYKLALAPVAETTADKNSYGFREGRSCADAIAAAFNTLGKPNSATHILEGDIEGCYDNISKSWLMNNIPMDKTILKTWLDAGYVENGVTYPSHKGTPQGGIISPTLANMTLDGLQQVVKTAVPYKSRVNFIRYADDFIVTAKSRKLLLEKVRPAIEEFLRQRGLQLSPEKTSLTHIKKGFTFLGQTFLKTGNKLRITPAKEGVFTLIRKVGTVIRKHVSAPMEAMVKALNPILRGWANYHRHVVSSNAFHRVDTYVHKQLWRMLRKRHPKKSKKWLFQKYWSAARRDNVFSFVTKYKNKPRHLQVIRVNSIKLRKHLRIRVKANPYMPEYSNYFWCRRNIKGAKLMGGFSNETYREAKAFW